MTSDQWARTKRLFSAAIALPEAERETFLRSETDSLEILGEVRSLLATYRVSPDFLDGAEPAIPAQSPSAFSGNNGEHKLLQRFEALLSSQDKWQCSIPSQGDIDSSSDAPFDSQIVNHTDIPEHIGPYRILSTLGEGGMGIAYLAERDDGVYQHRVAVKVLKDTSHSPGLLKRFQNERQVLAGLDHPYIARLIDGGTTTSGQPYYAMEYVAGEPLTQYAQSRDLGLRERLLLFEAICDAVSAAHRQLVVHGDIKPANILIREDGSPKLLDFGLARIIQPLASDVTMSMVLLTPGYASPEQVRGERLSTSTDIYSLGVLLFELLTGKRPYGKETSSPLDLCRAICDDTPVKPSAAATIPRIGPRQLRGDLDHIVLKALRKSPDERYATAAELRSDIQRHLDGFPVEAARGSTLYHLRKFVIRRRWLVAAVAIILALATVATWRIWRAEKIAELRFNQVRQLAHSVVFDMHDAIQELPGSTMARKMLIERALEYLKALEATSGRNRDLELELARAYTKIGTVQAAAASASLEDCAAGIQNLEHARSLLHEILKRSSSDEDAISALIDADLQAANVHSRRGEMTNWKLLRSEATELLNDMAARHKDQPMWRLRALTAIATTFDGEHNPAAALKAYQDVLAAAAQVTSNPETLLLQARTERDVAEEWQALGNKQEALDHQLAAQQIFQVLLAASPDNTRFKLESSWTFTETGFLEHDSHNERAAMADFSRGLQLLKSIASADPGNHLARLEIGKLEMVASTTEELAVSPRRASEDLRDAIAIFSDTLNQDSTNDDVRIHLAQSEFMYGDLQVRMAHGRCSAGIGAYRRALGMASGVKEDQSATSVFDMRKLRVELQKRLSACGSGSRRYSSTKQIHPEP